jgi:hypothetical protein
MRKARTVKDDFEFLEWVAEHGYKDAPMSKWKITENAARSWMARIRNRYRIQRDQVNKITGLMHRSDRIKRMMLKPGVIKDQEDEPDGDEESEKLWKNV